MSDERGNAALQAARELCAANDSRLVYLSFFGSELYGTRTGNSDTDARGIFLPSMQSIILGQDKKSLHYSTGNNEYCNCSDDIDIDLWSVKNWVLNLLPGGDTGALDLLFSISNKDCVIYHDSLLDPVFHNPLKFLDLANNRSYSQYALSQAKKYGIKGSRLGAIRAVGKWIEENRPGGKLGPHIASIINVCGHEKYCFSRELPTGIALVLCGKIHIGDITMEEFGRRVMRDMDKYGKRARDAEANQGVDYKALSHALRALTQMEELLRTGKIIFPLASREQLKKVKKGEIPWNELEGIILSRLADVDHLYEKLSGKYSFDRNFAENFLLRCYGFSRSMDSSLISAAIREELSKIEKARNVRILYAAEAGSRAWGFPSQDSDYDIRFIYAHEPAWYLGAEPERQRDVIENIFNLPDIGEIDMSGWELRKALRILRSGNPQIAEWLKSPAIYMEKGELAGLLRTILTECLSQGGMWRHYAGLLKNALKKINNGNKSAKTLLYVIRPLLVLLWLERKLGIPPVRIEDLIAGVIEDAAIVEEIQELVEKKKFALERDNQAAGETLMNWIHRECQRLEENSPVLDYSRKCGNMDSLFRTVLMEAFSGAL